MARTYLFDAFTGKGWDSTDGPVNLGTQFTVDTNGTILGGRYFKRDSTLGDGATITMSLYGTGTTALASATRVQSAADPQMSWIEVTFTTPVTVTTGTTYTISWRSSAGNYVNTDEFLPGTALDYPPLHTTGNWALFTYGALAKPTSLGSYCYLIDPIYQPTLAAGQAAFNATGRLTAIGTDRPGVAAFDTEANIPNRQWMVNAYNLGYRLFIMGGTNGPTLNTPRANLETYLGWALDAGLKIGIYTRDPAWYQTGLDACGIHKRDLLFFAFDVELDPGTPVLRSWVDDCAAQGVQPIIYAGRGTWPTIQGATANNFTDIPLWDAEANRIGDMGIWAPNLGAPLPVVFNGWNTASNFRVGIQQKFTYFLDGVEGDVNTFDADFVGPPEQLSIPVGVTATRTASTVELTWTRVPAASRYEIERNGTVIATTVTGESYTDTALTPGTARSYRVRAVRDLS